ncbi:hypothetical protein PIB30_060571 [Stylosanthes scabra]|uniref:Uncharacterized protein n=1 Tax=Stylosanthes scabra TaxID=79078 RepID=A0ABU6WLC0_9FABA|nr:hypothetical protein [Stylosanthes scabra]
MNSLAITYISYVIHTSLVVSCFLKLSFVRPFVRHRLATGESRDGSYRKRGKPLASRSREGRGEGPTFNLIDRSVAYHPMLDVPEVFMWISGSVILHIGQLDEVPL